MSDSLRCLNCDSGPFPLEKAQGEYDPGVEAFVEACPSCGADFALVWAD